jgi:hypothetical protein
MDGSRLEFVAQPGSKLLSIPAELRNAIYELVLRSKEILRMRPECYDVSSQYRPTKCRSLDLLLTCRQIFTEAECLFYALNDLEYEAQSSLPGSILFKSTSAHGLIVQNPKDFVLSLGLPRQAALRAVTLVSPSMEIALEELTILLLPLATNLHTLNLKLPLRELRTREDAVDWASKVKLALRATSIMKVTVKDNRSRPRRVSLFSPRANLPLSPNEVLARTIEDMLESVVQN